MTRISRETLLKRASVGAVVFTAPVLTSTAAGQERLPRFVCKQGCEVDGDPCFGQRDCTNPDERFCTCLLRTSTNPPEGRCFCHEPSNCGDLIPCTSAQDCKAAGLDEYGCAASCCSYDVADKFCHPPCGTTAGGGAAAARGATSIGYIA